MFGGISVLCTCKNLYSCSLLYASVFEKQSSADGVHDKRNGKLLHICSNNGLLQIPSLRQGNEAEHMFDELTVNFDKVRIFICDWECEVIRYQNIAILGKGIFQHLGTESECIAAAIVCICAPLAEIVTARTERCFPIENESTDLLNFRWNKDRFSSCFPEDP